MRLHNHYLRLIRTAAPCPALVTREALDAKLARACWAPETRRSARSVARGFFRWCVAVEIMPRDPAKALPPIKVPPGCARPAADTIIHDALGSASERERLMIRFGAYCGLRACEIARVDGKKDWDGEQLLVHGKGAKLRMVPVVDPVLVMALNRADGYLFPGPNGHLSAGHVSVLLSRALPGGVTGHMLRHRFATVAYQATGDLLAVGAIMGHSKPETTKRYVQLPSDSLLAVMRGAAAA